MYDNATVIDTDSTFHAYGLWKRVEIGAAAASPRALAGDAANDST